MTTATCIPRWRPLTDKAQRSKREAAATLESDRARLLVRQSFLGSLAMRMDVVPLADARIPTAATDGRHLFFDAEFMLGLDETERLFAMAHEIWHCAALHFPRRGRRDPERWNIAIDHEVNNLLREQDFSLPEGVVWFREFRGCNAETVYEHLDDLVDELPGRGELADVHDVPWTIGAASGAAEFDPVPFDPDFKPVGDASVWRDWPRRVHAAAQQAYADRGSQPAWLERFLPMLGTPSLPWPSILRQYLEQSRSGGFHWSRPNRRCMAQGLILPGQASERLRLAVVIDSSGSTSQQLPRFLAELRGMLGAFGRYEIRLLSCDAAIHTDESFSEARPLPDSMVIKGGGGSDLCPAFKLLASDQPNCLVALTDGFTKVPDRPPSWPVIWCLARGGAAPAPLGTTVNMDQSAA